MTDRFSICLPFTLAQERNVPTASWGDPRNFDNNVHDPGGKTQDGIIQREYDSYRKSCGLACRDVRQLTRPEGETIYEKNYWLPHCPSLPPGLDLQFFDSSVNEACLEAVRILQYILDLKSDGLWGPKTAAAVANLGKAIKIPVRIEDFTARRKEVYRESKGFQYFGKDWLRRADEIGAQALKMVSQNSPLKAR